MIFENLKVGDKVAVHVGNRTWGTHKMWCATVTRVTATTFAVHGETQTFSRKDGYQYGDGGGKWNFTYAEPWDEGQARRLAQQERARQIRMMCRALNNVRWLDIEDDKVVEAFDALVKIGVLTAE